MPNTRRSLSFAAVVLGICLAAALAIPAAINGPGFIIGPIRDLVGASFLPAAAGRSAAPDKEILAPQADQFFAGDGSALTASKWAATSAGPFTSAFTAGNVANFATANGTGTGASITVGGINATENFTLSS